MVEYPVEKLELLTRPAGNLVMIAPPGCGKTEALALRAKGLLDIGAISSPRRILALTFSNRARDNINARLRDVLGEATYLRYISVSNFHGFAYRVYKAHASTLGLNPEAAMPEKTWLAGTLRNLGASAKIARDAEALIRLVKLDPLSDEDVMSQLLAVDPDFAAEAERMRIAENRLDYSDLLRHAQRLLAIPAIARLYSLHFGALLVDEYQDLTEQQLDIVLAINKANATFAGDAGQAIYSFAGANVEAVDRRLQELIGVEFVRFTHSYRSAPAVLRVVNSVSGNSGTPMELRSADPHAWPEGGATSCVAFEGENDEAAWVVGLADFILKEDPGVSLGVISRVNYRRRTLDDAARKIDRYPVRHWENPAYSPDVIRILRLELRRVIQVKEVDESERLRMLELGCFATVEPTDIDLVADMRQALEFLGDAVSGGSSLSGAIGNLRVSDKESAPIGPGLHLLNAHVGKGQQFDWVVILGLEEGLIPDFRAKTPKDIQEEKRALLVMASRARFGVFTTRVEFTTGLYGPRAATRSRWWDALEGSASCRPDEIFDAIHANISARPRAEASTDS